MNIMIATRSTSVAPDYAAIRHRQQATWAAGDYAVVGLTLQIAGERLCEAIDLRSGERVLDVAATGTLRSLRPLDGLRRRLARS